MIAASAAVLALFSLAIFAATRWTLTGRAGY